jgi:hypothetical protein
LRHQWPEALPVSTRSASPAISVVCRENRRRQMTGASNRPAERGMPAEPDRQPQNPNVGSINCQTMCVHRAESSANEISPHPLVTPNQPSESRDDMRAPRSRCSRSILGSLGVRMPWTLSHAAGPRLSDHHLQQPGSLQKRRRRARHSRGGRDGIGLTAREESQRLRSSGCKRMPKPCP